MANTRLIKRRIKSVQNISQITRAMEMVAASKMKKAQDSAVLGKPYADKIYQVARELAKRTQSEFHPLLSLGDFDGKLLVILITTNKGLCGGLNTNLFRKIQDWYRDIKNIEIVTIGKKGQRFAVRTDSNLIADFSDEYPFTKVVPAVTQLIVDGYLRKTYNQVHLVYNTFFSAMKQIPTKKRALPISAFEESSEKVDESLSFSEFIVEPDVKDLLDNLLPHYLENQVRTAILEAEASEHSARMIAMKNATDAARDLSGELTLIYNKARQEKITNEIADLVVARMAVDV